MELNETVLVDVFADYTDPGLPALWQRAVSVANELQQRRVVIRAPGETADARRAVKLAECARDKGKFAEVQRLLIEHDEPWDEETLVRLVAPVGLNQREMRRCLGQTEVRAQIAKDREHARIYGIETFPTVTVNRQITPGTDKAIRRAIRAILEEESI